MSEPNVRKLAVEGRYDRDINKAIMETAVGWILASQGGIYYSDLLKRLLMQYPDRTMKQIRGIIIDMHQLEHKALGRVEKKYRGLYCAFGKSPAVDPTKAKAAKPLKPWCPPPSVTKALESWSKKVAVKSKPPVVSKAKQQRSYEVVKSPKTGKTVLKRQKDLIPQSPAKQKKLVESIAKEVKTEIVKAVTGAVNLAVMLNSGAKLVWPEKVNAVRVQAVKGGSMIILKEDADTLKGAGIVSAQLGYVPNDAKGRPVRAKFEAVEASIAAAEQRKPAKLYAA